MVLKRENEIFSPGHAFLSANLGHSVSPWSSAASDSNIQSARLELWSITGARALGEVDLWLKWTKLLESYIYLFLFSTHQGHGRLTNSKSAKSVYVFPFSVNLCLFFVLFRLFYEAVAIHALIGGAAHGHCTLRSVWCAAAPIQGVISRIEIWQNIYQW